MGKICWAKPVYAELAGSEDKKNLTKHWSDFFTYHGLFTILYFVRFHRIFHFPKLWASPHKNSNYPKGIKLCKECEYFLGSWALYLFRILNRVVWWGGHVVISPILYYILRSSTYKTEIGNIPRTIKGAGAVHENSMIKTPLHCLMQSTSVALNPVVGDKPWNYQ